MRCVDTGLRQKESPVAQIAPVHRLAQIFSTACYGNTLLVLNDVDTHPRLQRVLQVFANSNVFSSSLRTHYI